MPDPAVKTALDAQKALSKNIADTHVANFAYNSSAYTANHYQGHDDFDETRDNNIPNGTAAVLDTNPTTLNLGYRSNASSFTRQLVNHFWGRVSFNLNKISDILYNVLNTIVSYIGAPGGLASLDEHGRVPFDQLPTSAMEFKGFWDADTNTPQLADGTGTNGDMYIVSVAGTRDLGSGTETYLVDDRIIYSGSTNTWGRLPAGTVTSVNNVGPVNGNVTLSKSDMGLGNVQNIDQSGGINALSMSGSTMNYATLGGGTGNITLPDFAGTNGVTAGTAGVVPAPAVGDANKFLRGDGTWDTPASVTYGLADVSSDGLVPHLYNGTDAQLRARYLRGDNTWQELPEPPVMTGATGSTNGAKGLVPAPAAGYQGTFLRGDGSWVAINKSYIGLGNVQNLGVDYSPTVGSGNYVTSGGVYSALAPMVVGYTGVTTFPNVMVRTRDIYVANHISLVTITVYALSNTAGSGSVTFGIRVIGIVKPDITSDITLQLTSLSVDTATHRTVNFTTPGSSADKECTILVLLEGFAA